MSPGIPELLAWRVHWCRVLWPARSGSGGSFGHGAEGNPTLSAQDNSFFPVRSEHLLIFPSPQSGSYIQNKFPPTPASWGPVLHPAADLLLFPVLFALWRAGCQTQPKSRRDLAQRCERAGRRMGGSSLLLAFSHSVSRPAS